MWNNLGTAYEQLARLDDARTAFENGGKLGSKEALASRKRLDGVKTIVVMKTTAPGEKPEKPATTGGYDRAEPMPPAPEPASAEPTEPSDDASDTGDAASEAAPAEKPAPPSPL
jgi:hypothetical protein